MSSAFERFLATFSKDIYLNSTHPECLNVIVKSVSEQQQKFLIDRTLFPNCIDRKDAMVRVQKLFLVQGLSLSKFGYTLKKTDKVKHFVVN